jgi:DNA-binding transcriptional regulator/RsmH inhibitor MraZ
MPAPVTRAPHLRETGFYAVHRIKLQPALRLTLPDSFRQLLSRDTIVVYPQFHLVNETLCKAENDSIMVIAPKSYHQSALAQLSPPNRLLLEAATTIVEMDEQRQITIPDSFVRAHNITVKDQLVVVGCGDYCELWRKGDWERYKAHLDDPATRLELQRKLAELGL